MPIKNSSPSFIFIGPDKTGSSWLFEYLRSHPQCFIPECKDIYFFDRYYDKGIDWYTDFFKKELPTHRASGEICHDYLFSFTAAQRIYNFNTKILLITSLRNPVERSFSHYLYLLRSGITRDDFWSATKAHPEIIENSLYFKHLKGYFDLFSRNSICVLDFNQLQESPNEYAATTCTFLGLDYYAPPNTGIVRPAAKARSFYAAKLLKFMATQVRNLGFPTLVGKIKHSKLTQFLYTSYAHGEKPKLSPDDRAQLSQHFIEDTRNLDDLLETKFEKSWFKD